MENLPFIAKDLPEEFFTFKYHQVEHRINPCNDKYNYLEFEQFRTDTKLRAFVRSQELFDDSSDRELFSLISKVFMLDFELDYKENLINPYKAYTLDKAIKEVECSGYRNPLEFTPKERVEEIYSIALEYNKQDVERIKWEEGRALILKHYF